MSNIILCKGGEMGLKYDVNSCLILLGFDALAIMVAIVMIHLMM